MDPQPVLCFTKSFTECLSTMVNQKPQMAFYGSISNGPFTKIKLLRYKVRANWPKAAMDTCS